ncbi:MULTISPECIES: GtrA family protein [Cupriavidus]
MIKRETISQLFRYAVVGMMSNFLGYVAYIVVTYLGATPKITMTFLYGMSAAIGFFGNRSLTFRDKGKLLGAGGRYIVVHCLGYLVNLAILVVMVDKLGYPHQWVQAAAIFIVAVFLFFAFKFFVFTSRRNSAIEAE